MPCACQEDTANPVPNLEILVPCEPVTGYDRRVMRPFEPDFVEDDVWVGRAPSTPEDFAYLKDLGITDILTLQTEDEARSIGIRPSVGFRVAGANGLVLHRVPIEDFSHRELARKAGEAADLVQRLRERGRHVYVHCAVGLNRSPTVVATYLGRLRNLGAEDACGLVEHAHPSQPDEEAVRIALEEG